MQKMQNLAEILQGIILDWILKSKVSGLSEAVESTISGDFFNKSDIEFAINQLKFSVQRNEITKWVNRNFDENKLNDEVKFNSIDRRILCLHAGNLPLVGLQDMLVVLLSGAQYYGKISRKDPFLLPSLLKYIQNRSTKFNITFSLDIQDFSNKNIQEWMFAGSEESLNSLNLLLKENSIISVNNSRSLIRTARFSVVIIDQWNRHICADLIESIFRYEGKGCRSVAIVYSDRSLSELSPDLKNEAERWLNKNGYPNNLTSNIQIQAAYNDAVGINQVQLGNALIQEGVVSSDDPNLIYWQPKMNIDEINVQHGLELQQIYLTHFGLENDVKLARHWKYDLLENAQCPPLWWRPDGTDVLNWIMSK